MEYVLSAPIDVFGSVASLPICFVCIVLTRALDCMGSNAFVEAKMGDPDEGRPCNLGGGNSIFTVR